MLSRRIAAINIFVILLAGSQLFFSQTLSFYEALAVELTTFVEPKLNEANANFEAVTEFKLTYPANSPLSKNLTNIHENVSFKANMSTLGMNELISKINQVLLTEKQSVAQIKNATLDYHARIDGSPGQLKVAFLVRFKPLLEDVTLPSQNTIIKILDLDWRSFTTNDPLILSPKGIGPIDVNHPIGLFQPQLLMIASMLKESDETILTKPFLDFQVLSQPLGEWQFSFNRNPDLASLELQGPISVSTFSLNESNFNKTLDNPEQKTVFTVNGTTVNVNTLSVYPPVAHIQVVGFAQVKSTPIGEFVVVMSKAPINETIDSIQVNLTTEEKLTVERDATSIINKCSDKLNGDDNEGLAKCDVYLKYLLDKCNQFANTLSYCDDSKFSNYFYPRYSHFK